MAGPRAISSVLIVDDAVSNIELLAKVLGTDYDVLFATSGDQALELLGRVRPDLILLDVVMPGMDGYELFARLKAEPLTGNIPVVFVTGLDDLNAESRALELGAVDYVTKPINGAIVRARVHNQIELKRARDVLEQLAAHDGLTGLANRRSFDLALEAEAKRLGRMRAPLALVMIDVDSFKAYNDGYGHLAGDAALRRVADVVATSMRRSPDLAARYGGEEFACILPETEPDGARDVAERIRAGIAGLAIPHRDAPARIVTASVGVADAICEPGMDTADLIALADERLYRAKAAGRNRVVAI